LSIVRQHEKSLPLHKDQRNKQKISK